MTPRDDASVVAPSVQSFVKDSQQHQLGCIPQQHHQQKLKLHQQQPHKSLQMMPLRSLVAGKWYDMALSVNDFYFHFIIPNSNKTHQISHQNMKAAIYNHLVTTRLTQSDVYLSDEGKVWISSRGHMILEKFRNETRANAAIMIQKTYRGRNIRKNLRLKALDSSASSSSPKGSFLSHSPSSEDRREDNDMEKLERRRLKLKKLKNHLIKVSTSYQEVIALTENLQTESTEPTEMEIEFMHLLNSEETFKLSANLLSMHKLEQVATLEEAQKSFEAQSGILGGQSPAQMYEEYAPRIVEWIGLVLNMCIPTNMDLVSFLRSGDVLCSLTMAMYPRMACQLLVKGREFTIHKIIFFLELCKTVGIKSPMLFSVADLLLGSVEDDPLRKSALTVLRTVCALERQARRKGWNGASMVLKPEGSTSEQRRRSRLFEQKLLSLSLKSSSANMGGSSSSNLDIDKDISVRSSASYDASMDTGDVEESIFSSSLAGHLNPVASVVGNTTGDEAISSLVNFSATSDVPQISSHDLLNECNNENGQLQQAVPPDSNKLSYSKEAEPIFHAPGTSARNSLFILHTYDLDQGGSKESLKREWSKDMHRILETTIIRNEEKKNEIEVAELRAGLAKRTLAIKKFLKDEEEFVNSLIEVADYLSHVVSKRHSRSSSFVIDDKSVSAELIPATIIATQAVKKMATKLQHSDMYTPNPGETATKAGIRVETENEEVSLLHRVLEDLVALHKGLIDDVKGALESVGIMEEVKSMEDREQQQQQAENELDGPVPFTLHTRDSSRQGAALKAAMSATVLQIGDALMRFAADAVGAYITYSVVALKQNCTASTECTDQFSGRDEILVRSVNRFMAEKTGVAVSNEWTWSMKCPLDRLERFEDILQNVIDRSGPLDGLTLKAIINEPNPEKRMVFQDNMRLKVALVKLQAIVDAIKNSVY